MITVGEAAKILLEHTYVPRLEHIPLSNALGRYLASDIQADRDFPPFDRVAMDGFAIRTADFSGPGTRFSKAGIGWAGRPAIEMPPGCMAVEVMTGAVLPVGADAVVRIEDVELIGEEVVIRVGVKSGQHIHTRGADAINGTVLLKAGTRITAAEIPVLATVGAAMVPVWSLPRVAVVSTGDELVAVSETPEPHQIRKSNVFAVEAGLSRFGIRCSHLHFSDHEPDAAARLALSIADHDVLIITGGVSKGKKDWVPGALADCGVTKYFHSVSQRPGKPFWFGGKQVCAVFAFPGNPASVFLCLHRYLLPWLEAGLSRRESDEPGGMREPMQALLAADHRFDAPLTLFLQVRTEFSDGVLTAFPVPGNGSGDMVSMLEADGFLELPMDESYFAAGRSFPYFGFRY